MCRDNGDPAGTRTHSASNYAELFFAFVTHVFVVYLNFHIFVCKHTVAMVIQPIHAHVAVRAMMHAFRLGRTACGAHGAVWRQRLRIRI